MTIMSLDEIDALALAALRRCGATELQALPTANSIREAEADGIRHVGLGYLPTYCGHLLCGKVVGGATPRVDAPDGATLRVDAGGGFCHAAFDAALGDLDDLTRQMGVALLTISHSYSAGVLGWMVERLAERGLVSLGFANSSPLVAPWGGRTRKLGTNPFAFASPRAGRPPFVVDMATSATAYLNVLKAANEGREIPLGWALDVDGAPTTDPARGVEGSIAPLGGAKGFALGLVVEILAGGLTEGSWGVESSSFVDDIGGPPDVGQTFIAIDPTRRAPTFSARLESLFAAITEEPGVRLPGDRRVAARESARRDGVDVPDDLRLHLETVGGA